MPQTLFSIQKLKATVGEFAKGNRYNVSIFPPSGIPALVSNAAINKLPFLCESASLPTKGIATNPHDIHGPPREIAYRETFTESALSFILDDAFTVKRYFDDWQTNIVSPTTSNPSYYDNYVGAINITRLENNSTNLLGGPDKYRVRLEEAYPSAVGEVALGHSQGNEVLKLSVTFKYRKWNFIT
tara:strand:- start:290 stop:844 length:555 start_codon:yes stop_codon:yes gene_type:complete